MKKSVRFALLFGLLALSGCAGMGMGTLEQVLGGLPGMGSRVSGEVRRVDQRRREIRVHTHYGQRETVTFDRHTQVLYRRRRYSVRALERGDRVSMQVQRGRDGWLYADVIHVERSARERRRDDDDYEDDDDYDDYDDYDRDYSLGRVQRFEGRVKKIDHRRGRFELRGERHGKLEVTLSSRLHSSTLRRFHRLRRGDYVRLDGIRMDRREVELRRFR